MVSEHVGLHSKSPLLSSLVQAKVVVFELQCLACFHIWHSTVIQILEPVHPSSTFNFHAEQKPNLLMHVPELQHYFIEHKEPNLSLNIHLHYYYPEHQWFGGNSILQYVIWHLTRNGMDSNVNIWTYFTMNSDHMDDTSHTSNNVLATQANCPMDVSLDEFIAFGYLWSGGSLQWLNILQGLCSRTLNLRCHHVHHLVTQATSEVRPLNLTTGVWIWHQELEDLSFCNALLDELKSLFMDVRTCLLDRVMMNTISLLLTWVLALSPSEDISEQAIALLWNVHRKTFKWIEELQYNLIMAPMNEECSRLLLDMAATCQSTFDIDTATLHRLCHSVEDVDALLSCTLFVPIPLPTCTSHSWMSVTLNTHKFNLQPHSIMSMNVHNCCLNKAIISLSLLRGYWEMWSLLIHQIMVSTLQLARFLLTITQVHANGRSCSIQTFIGLHAKLKQP